MPSDTEDAVSKASALATGKMADLRLDTTQNQVGHFNYLFLIHLLLMCVLYFIFELWRGAFLLEVHTYFNIDRSRVKFDIFMYVRLSIWQPSNILHCAFKEIKTF